MDAALEKKLIQCLDALEEGRSLEQALALFPEDVDRLRPLLAAAGQLSEMRVGHRLESQVKSRQQFLAHAEKLRSGAVRPIPTRTWRRLSFSLALVTLLLVISTSGLFASARRALPGDILFGTKLALEDARMALTNDPSARESLRNQFQQERMEEIRQLLASGRRADVTFTGFIESMAGETWSIAGLPVQVNDQTVIDGEPAVGKLAEVIGRTESGVVVAAEIVVRTDPNAPLPTPSPSPQPPPTVTDTPAPSPSPTVRETPSATNTPSATPTPTATPTGTPSPSPTVTPFPTATPTSDHGNTNDDDNTNDNDGTNDNDDTNDDDDTNDNDNDNDNINNYE